MLDLKESNSVKSLDYIIYNAGGICTEVRGQFHNKKIGGVSAYQYYHLAEG